MLLGVTGTQWNNRGSAPADPLTTIYFLKKKGSKNSVGHYNGDTKDVHLQLERTDYILRVLGVQTTLGTSWIDRSDIRPLSTHSALIFG